MTRLFPKGMRLPQASKLDNITLRGFTGGLNRVDSDLAMDPRFLVSLNNFRNTPNGPLKKRFGNRWFTELHTGLPNQVSGNIVDMEYFSDNIIAVTDTGEIGAVNNAGSLLPIWSVTIASLLPGTPAGWSTGLDSIDFVPFKSQLIIHNGIDKPITISSGLFVTYLQDLATSSNVNTPIGKYGCVVANYHCVAGIPAAPTTIYISSKGTAGTFPGDPIPNDSISIDVGAYAPEGASEIRGVAGFRSNLIVFFRAQALVIELGHYVEDPTDPTVLIHTPQFPDTLPPFGILGHRCMVQVENDLRFAGLNGLNSAKRSLYIPGVLDSDALSSRVEPLYKGSVGILSNSQLLKNCFVVYDAIAHDTFVYLPGGKAIVFGSSDKLKYQGWSTFDTPQWTCGCTSFLGRVFLAKGSRIYQQGNTIYSGEEYDADLTDDRDFAWNPVTSYVAGNRAIDIDTGDVYEAQFNFISGGGTFANERTLNPDRWALFEGQEVPFEMELPWLDSRDPMKVKQLKFISIASKGTAKFTVDAYVDNLYKDRNGVVQYSPALSMDFMGNDAAGFGYDAGPYGGGRRSNDPRLFSFPLKFKSLKIVIHGTSRDPLEIDTISFLFTKGKYRR